MQDPCLYTLERISHAASELADTIPAVPEGSDMSWLNLHRISSPSIDREIADAIDTIWHEGSVTLPPEMAIQLFIRLQFASWFLMQMSWKHPTTTRNPGQALIGIVSAATEAWHACSAAWLLALLGHSDMLGRNTLPTSCGGTCPYLSNWESKYPEDHH